ncbi:endolytic transglycosylase MltG [Tissierella sp. MB52-C2]|uniref:endolytic transglycosylase MltG n=1 Tax=Tissierella sp. MB52-C2 TaxID=3070999 RepID=UPI00280BCDA4|nr:endolytic transglycosylase MltG [Tissierella sp. MB52-C2]WMM23258.1 endolytic transglycosylase MltG [Tissierella sp. MB52-C2]
MEKAKMRKSRKRRFSVLIIFIILLSVGIFANNYYREGLLAMNPDDSSDVLIVIPSSSSVSTIANILHENKLIKSPLIFKIKVKTSNVASTLKAGEYNLSTDMDLDTIISKLVKGGKDRNIVKFTIPEGYELEQMAEKLAKEGIVNEERFIQLSSDKKNFEEEFPFLKELEKGQSLEGFLFPSTYEIFAGAREEDVIEKMLHEFEKVYEKDLASKLKELDISLNEAVTLASIVEREGKVDEERPLMSAVFYNRIKKDMMLQSCATVQYVLGERKEVLTNEDTRIDSPYNTYINQGLPPGPIASPGEASLVAAVNPADVDYLFFVLTGDGTHTFTKTYEEHLQAKPKK